MGITLSVLAGRAIQLQGIDASANALAAAQAMTHTQVLKAQRGALLDRNGQVLAETLPAVKVVADPYVISINGASNRAAMTSEDTQRAAIAPAAIAQIVATYLGGKPADYLPQLTHATDDQGNPDMYEVLKRQVPTATYQALLAELRANGWMGIYKEDDPIRQYPGGALASNVVGFLNGDGQGAAGLEYAFDDQLNGTDGQEVYQTSAYGRIPLGTSILQPAVDGTTYTLTIDSEMQWQLQQELARAVTNAKAKSGTGIIMDVKTGEVLGLADYPTFDSNAPGKADPADLGNRAVTDAYEPGSVEKVLTFAALLDQGLITPETRVEVPGRLQSGGGYIYDADRHPNTEYLTARGVIYNSSNIGAAELARLMDKATLSRYLTSFGLGRATGIELPGEPTGALGLVPDANMPDYTRDQIAFGQGLSVTTVQEAAALAAIVDGGVYHTPTVIASAVDGAGKPVTIARSPARRVISPQASAMMLDMMESVVAADPGAAKRVIPGYRMAGKSGTSQTVDPATGRYTNNYVSSYVAVAPVEDPTILIYIVVNSAPNVYGIQAAFPAARDLMMLALPRYGILPQANIPPYTKPIYYQP